MVDVVFPVNNQSPLGVGGHQTDQLIYVPGDKIDQLDWATEGPDVLVWHEIGIALRFSRFHDGHGELTAMVRIYTRGVIGIADRDLFDAKVVLTGSRSKTDCVRVCEKLLPDWPYWSETVDRACRIVRSYIENGTPPVNIALGPLPDEPPWLLEPLFRSGENALLFGDGGTGKSTLALWFLLSLAPTQRVLYLDYEDSEARMRRRLHDIALGMGMDPINRPVMYKEADLGVPQSIDAIARHIAAAKIEGMVVDSAALACGIEPEKAEAAIGYFRALRLLHLKWTLTICHQPKDKANQHYPFGSIFWWNTARNIWQTRMAQEPGEGVLHVALQHQKANNGPIQKPMAYEITRHDGMVAINREEPRSVSAFRAKLSHRERVLAVLEDEPEMIFTYEVLESRTGLNDQQLRLTMHRLGREVEKVGKGFRLVTPSSPYWTGD